MTDLFSLAGRTAVITGASGSIGSAIAMAYADAGANIAMTYNHNPAGLGRANEHATDLGVIVDTAQVDVLDKAALDHHAEHVASKFGRLDVLVNCAGGNIKSAMTDKEIGFFDLAPEAIIDAFNLNVMGGAILPCLCYGPKIAAGKSGGSIINISSMNAYRPLEGRPAYAASKAAVSNFTQWLACHLAKEYSTDLRVNAIAPGFFPNDRMRETLFNSDGSQSERGAKIITHTPMQRLGAVEDLIGTAIWYASDASRFVTGTITPVDGGFNAYSGI